MLLMRPAKGLPIFVTLAIASFMATTTAEAVGPGPVGRGTASAFAVLGGSTVTNTGPTVITGDLGLSPGTAISGFPPGQVNGTIHQTNAVALQAKKDLDIAYDDAAGRASNATISADLGGQTLTSGVYTSGSSLHLTGTLTLDGQGDENAVFIFQAGSTLITASASRVVMIGRAQACNLVWQVGSSATLGTNSVFKGNILALESISVTQGTTVDGSTLARNGAVTLDDNTISGAACSGAPATGTTATTAPGGGSTATSGPSGGTTGTGGGGTGSGTGTGTGTGTGDGSTGIERGTSGVTDPNGEITTDALGRQYGPLASTGVNGKGMALSGLTFTGLGLMILRVTRRRPVR